MPDPATAPSAPTPNTDPEPTTADVPPQPSQPLASVPASKAAPTIESFNRKLIVGLIAMVVILITVIAVLVTKIATSTDTSIGRTVSVTGQATLKAEPDEYVFYPRFTFKNANKDAALADMTKKSNEIVASLKKLGVSDKDIKSNADGNDSDVYYQPLDAGTDKSTYSLQLTVTVADKALVKKVQDYLVTVAPTGGVSPQVDFSDAKRKELESKARDDATKDARAKADQSAKNLGFKVGKVKTISDGSGFNDIPYSIDRGAAMAIDSIEPSVASLDVQPGENELNYSVTVVYEIK